MEFVSLLEHSGNSEKEVMIIDVERNIKDGQVSIMVKISKRI